MGVVIDFAKKSKKGLNTFKNVQALQNCCKKVIYAQEQWFYKAKTK